MTTARRIDYALCAGWLALLALGFVLGFPAGLLVFFGFAAGERWGVGWYR